MKYVIFLFVLVSSLPCLAQQDSVVYKKLPNSTEIYQSDSLWYKITYTRDGYETTIRTTPYTDVDSLIRRTLLNAYQDASRQYRSALLAWEGQERGYQLRLRQAERQYFEFIKKPLRDEIQKEIGRDTAFVKELLGDWLLNDKKVKIDEKLTLEKQPIQFVSNQQFFVQVEKEQVTFFRVNARRWQSKDAKFVLRREEKKNDVKTTPKTKHK